VPLPNGSARRLAPRRAPAQRCSSVFGSCAPGAGPASADARDRADAPQRTLHRRHGRRKWREGELASGERADIRGRRPVFPAHLVPCDHTHARPQARAHRRGLPQRVGSIAIWDLLLLLGERVELR
jgi:hypothetical protein